MISVVSLVGTIITAAAGFRASKRKADGEYVNEVEKRVHLLEKELAECRENHEKLEVITAALKEDNFDLMKRALKANDKK